MRRRSRRQPLPHRDGWIATGLILLAWVHRLIFLRSNRDWSWPYTFFYEGDSETFFDYARSILAGKLYDNGFPYHPPGFAWFLAFVHGLVGASEPGAKVPYVAVKSVLALVAACAVGLLYLLVRPYLGRTVALIAALLCTYHFGLYVLSIAPASEGTYLTLSLLALLVWSRRLEHPLAAPGDEPRGGARAALLLGVLLGAMALVRAEGLLVAALLVGVGLLGALRREREERRPALRPWLLVLLGGVLVIAPWTIRNGVRMSELNERYAGRLAEPLPRFVPLTIYGPINLILANNPLADGGFSRAYLSSQMQAPVLDVTDPQHLAFILHGDRMAWEWIRQNPGDFLRLVGRKWKLTAEVWKLGWTQFDWPGGLNGKRRPVDVFVPNSNAGFWIGPPLALLGLLLCLATSGDSGGPRRWAGVTLLMTLVTLASTGLFFGYVRLALLVLPFWLALAAATPVWIASLRHGRVFRLPPPADPPRRLWQALGVAAALLLALELWGVTLHRNFRASGTNVPGTNYLDRDAPVTYELLP